MQRPEDPSAAPARPLRVAISGGAGFIGAALARELCARGAEVRCLDDLSTGRRERLPAAAPLRLGDVSTRGTWSRFLAEEGPFDVLVHLAARVGVRAVLADPAGCRRANEEGVRELVRALERLPRERRPRVLAASSSEVYAESDAPLAEGAPLRALDGVGRWAYAGSKLAAERALDAAAPLWPGGRGPVHLRFFNVVGPGQDPTSGMVLARFVERALQGRPLPVHGEGTSVRTFAHVAEVARVLADLCAHPALPPGPLNVGGAARASVLELARTVARLSGSSAGIEPVDPRADCGAGFEEVRSREPALGRLAALGVGVPSMGLEELVLDTLLEEAAALASYGAGRPACASPAS